MAFSLFVVFSFVFSLSPARFHAKETAVSLTRLQKNHCQTIVNQTIVNEWISAFSQNFPPITNVTETVQNSVLKQFDSLNPEEDVLYERLKTYERLKVMHAQEKTKLNATSDIQTQLDEHFDVLHEHSNAYYFNASTNIMQLTEKSQIEKRQLGGENFEKKEWKTVTEQKEAVFTMPEKVTNITSKTMTDPTNIPNKTKTHPPQTSVPPQTSGDPFSTIDPLLTTDPPKHTTDPLKHAIDPLLTTTDPPKHTTDPSKHATDPFFPTTHPFSPTNPRHSDPFFPANPKHWLYTTDPLFPTKPFVFNPPLVNPKHLTKNPFTSGKVADPLEIYRRNIDVYRRNIDVNRNYLPRDYLSSYSRQDRRELNRSDLNRLELNRSDLNRLELNRPEFFDVWSRKDDAFADFYQDSSVDFYQESDSQVDFYQDSSVDFYQDDFYQDSVEFRYEDAFVSHEDGIFVFRNYAKPPLSRFRRERRETLFTLKEKRRLRALTENSENFLKTLSSDSEGLPSLPSQAAADSETERGFHSGSPASDSETQRGFHSRSRGFHSGRHASEFARLTADSSPDSSAAWSFALSRKRPSITVTKEEDVTAEDLSHLQPESEYIPVGSSYLQPESEYTPKGEDLSYLQPDELIPSELQPGDYLPSYITPYDMMTAWRPSDTDTDMMTASLEKRYKELLEKKNEEKSHLLKQWELVNKKHTPETVGVSGFYV